MKRLSVVFFGSRDGQCTGTTDTVENTGTRHVTPHRLSKSLSDLVTNNDQVNFDQDLDLPLKIPKSKSSFFNDLKRKVFKTFHKKSFSRVSVRRFSTSVKNLFDNRTIDTNEADNNNTEVNYETLPARDAIQKQQTVCVKKPPTSLAWEIFKLVKYGWYWGKLTPSEAEQRLKDLPDGAFLVRDSSNDCHILSLSFRSYGRTLHSRIEHRSGYFSLHGDSDTKFETIPDLILFFMERSNEGMFCFMRSRNPSPSMPVRLIKPVSRFVNVQSLQALCAFEIRQYVRMDNVQSLPVPERLKHFIYYPSS
ncbi:suppressor of cytokine signaling 6-like [Artemia franciscana]|uniref:Suppressor of cytokine signaling 6 n=1 Tax=Artemia franciscana TaxID=6661 RepID=A0AA88LFI9_ARTSF|nr:hypothetical protein QYM36_002981 [Artemia franciscana]